MTYEFVVVVVAYDDDDDDDHDDDDDCFKSFFFVIVRYVSNRIDKKILLHLIKFIINRFFSSLSLSLSCILLSFIYIIYI